MKNGDVYTLKYSNNIHKYIVGVDVFKLQFCIRVKGHGLFSFREFGELFEKETVMKSGDIYTHRSWSGRFVVGKDILLHTFAIVVVGFGQYGYNEFDKYFKKESTVKGDKHTTAVENVKAHLINKGWYVVQTQCKGQPVNVLQGGNWSPTLPPLLAFKGEKERWVWVMYKSKPSKGDHGIEEIKVKGFKAIQNVTKVPVWVYIYEADTDNILRISLDKYKILKRRIWVTKMRRAMWFLNREEFKGA